ncbi:unnamed protein product, partial [Oppiella nova]
MTSSVRSRVTWFCSPDFPRNETFSRAECLNANRVKRNQKCFQTLKTALQKSVVEKRALDACCGLSTADTCSARVVREDCGRESADFFARALPIADSLQMFCESKEEKFCDKTSRALIGWRVASRDSSAL